MSSQDLLIVESFRQYMFPLCTSLGDVEISDILSRDTVTASPRLEVQARSREPPGQVVAR